MSSPPFSTFRKVWLAGRHLTRNQLRRGLVFFVSAFLLCLVASRWWPQVLWAQVYVNGVRSHDWAVYRSLEGKYLLTVGGSPAYVINPQEAGAFSMGQVVEDSQDRAFSFFRLPGCIFNVIASVPYEKMPGLMVIDDPHLTVQRHEIEFTTADTNIRQKVRIQF